MPNINLYSCYETFVKATNKRKTGKICSWSCRTPVMKANLQSFVKTNKKASLAVMNVCG